VYSTEFVKDEFSKALEAILSKESAQQAQKVLENCYEKINDHNSAFIAQTIARLNMLKLQNPEKAIDWAEKANRIIPDHFAIVDTVGQAYKHALKSKRKELEKVPGMYSLKDEQCCEMMKLGKNATERFQKAEKLFEEKFSYHINDDESDSEENPDVYMGTGEIETNLEILELFLKSSELKGKEKEKKRFITALTKFSFSQDVSYVLPNVSWVWDEFRGMTDNLYQRTLHCFSQVTKNMNYLNHSNEDKRMEKLGWQVKSFGKIFGVQPNVWKNAMVSQDINPDQKVEHLRSFPIIKFANKFTWACKNFSEEEMLDIYLRMSEIKKFKTDGVHMTNDDKLCLVNAIMSSLHTFGSQRGILSKMSYNELNKIIYEYSHELVINKMDAPEPYLFYMMMNWPSESENPPTYCNELLIQCQDKLKQFENRNKNFIERKLPPIFFFQNDVSSSGLQRLYPFKQKSSKRLLNLGTNAAIKKLTGDVVNDTFICCKFPQGDSINIRPADLNLVRSGGITRVTFQLGFTFGGPVAYSVENDEERIANEKMAKFQEI
jgi:hypothetical protein